MKMLGGIFRNFYSYVYTHTCTRTHTEKRCTMQINRIAGNFLIQITNMEIYYRSDLQE